MNVDIWENDGVPIKFLRHSVGHDVECETTNGELYKGKLAGMEDNMNVQLETVVCTTKNGTSKLMDHVLIRGSRVKILILPDFLNRNGIFQRRGACALGELRGRGSGVTAVRSSLDDWPAHTRAGSAGYNVQQTVNLWLSQPSTSGTSSHKYHQAPGSDNSPDYHQTVTSSPGSSTETYPASDWSPGRQPYGHAHHPAHEYNSEYTSTSTCGS